MLINLFSLSIILLCYIASYFSYKVLCKYMLNVFSYFMLYSSLDICKYNRCFSWFLTFFNHSQISLILSIYLFTKYVRSGISTRQVCLYALIKCFGATRWKNSIYYVFVRSFNLVPHIIQLR